MNSVEKIRAAIRENAMTLDDIRLINDTLRQKWDAIQRSTAGNFHVGQRVEWTSSRNGLTYKATVEKINQKTLTVRIDDGGQCKVASTLLRAASSKLATRCGE